MSIESRPKHEEPERQGSSRWRGFLRRLGLGAVGSTSQRKDNGAVTYQSGTLTKEPSSNGGSGKNGDTSDDSASTSTASERFMTVDEIVDAAVEKHHEATKEEAGRPEGRTVPELLLGAQRYPDPSIWEPEDIEAPLTLDAGYGDVMDFILTHSPPLEEDPEKP